MIDTHCHLDSPLFDADRGEVLERARRAGVEYLIAPATGPDRWQRLCSMRGPSIAIALGIHPQFLAELDPRGDAAAMEELDSRLSRGEAVAVGECGLDGPTAATGVPMERQREVLRAHLDLARRHRLPVVLHCLKAHDALMAVLAEAPLPAGGVLHSFSGAPEQVRKYASFGLHFSFAGPVTYQGAKKPLAAVRAVPPGRLLIETDAPDQAPRPHRGRCEPGFLPQVAEGVARALGVSADEVAAATTESARRLFRIER
jgi:TatD DNase family protein